MKDCQSIATTTENTGPRSSSAWGNDTVNPRRGGVEKQHMCRDHHQCSHFLCTLSVDWPKDEGELCLLCSGSLPPVCGCQCDVVATDPNHGPSRSFAHGRLPPCTHARLHSQVGTQFSQELLPLRKLHGGQSCREDGHTGSFFSTEMRRNQSSQTTKRTCPDSLNQGVSSVMNHLMTTGHRTICFSGDMHIQQGRGESSGCRTCQKRTPSKPPGLLDNFWPWPKGPRTSSDQRPPVSPARTTKRHRALGPISSGYVVSFLCRASARTAPSMFAAPLCGEPSLSIAHHRKVATRQPQFPFCVRRVRSAQGGPCPSPTC